MVGKSKYFKFEEFVKEGPKFWKQYVGSDEYQKLYQLSNGRPGEKTGAPLLSAYFPMESNGDDEFVDVLGIEVKHDTNSIDLETYIVPSATYAEFNCTYKTSMQTNCYIYGSWFASTGYQRDDNKPDIVAYFPIPFRPVSEMGVRWWIPVIGRP